MTAPIHPQNPECMAEGALVLEKLLPKIGTRGQNPAGRRQTASS